MAQAAHDEFMKVLEQDPKNTVAMASIASLYFNQKKLDEAQEWYEKLIAVDPKNKEAYYTLGVIAWTKTYPARMEARAKLGMKPEDPGPIKDKKVQGRAEGQEPARSSTTACRPSQKALADRPRVRRRHGLPEPAVSASGRTWRTPTEEYKKDTEIADDWVDKTLGDQEDQGGAKAKTPAASRPEK